MCGVFDGAADLLEKLKIPQEYVRFFSERISRIGSDSELYAAFAEAAGAYRSDDTLTTGDMAPRLDALAARMGESPYTVYFLFLLANTDALRKQYAARGIADEVYYNTLDDLRCKLAECVERTGVPGTTALEWYDRFFKLQLFGLGRFEYQVRPLRINGEHTLSCGLRVSRDNTALYIHIPSSGVPLTDDARYESYRKAHLFYRDLFGGGPALFQCSSWLLYPAHREFLPKTSNILRFMDDFEIISSSESDEFKDAWRVFGRYAGLPPEKLPTDTGLRAASANRLKSGGKTGGGTGVFLFDGEKILR